MPFRLMKEISVPNLRLVRWLILIGVVLIIVILAEAADTVLRTQARPSSSHSPGTWRPRMVP
jgi:hypothetical protein